MYPYDVRIPKIRISTRQADELRNHRLAGVVNYSQPVCMVKSKAAL